MDIITIVTGWTSDAILFPFLQLALLLFTLSAIFQNWLGIRRAAKGNVTLMVTRGETSMSRFYGTYAAINGLLIAICLSVDIAQNYRIFWVIVDTILVAYVCLFNPWFRNLLMMWADRLRKIEQR